MDLSFLICVNSTIDTSQSRSALIGSANDAHLILIDVYY